MSTLAEVLTFNVSTFTDWVLNLMSAHDVWSNPVHRDVVRANDFLCKLSAETIVSHSYEKFEEICPRHWSYMLFFAGKYLKREVITAMSLVDCERGNAEEFTTQVIAGALSNNSLVDVMKLPVDIAPIDVFKIITDVPLLSKKKALLRECFALFDCDVLEKMHGLGDDTFDRLYLGSGNEFYKTVVDINKCES